MKYMLILASLLLLVSCQNTVTNDSEEEEATAVYRKISAEEAKGMMDEEGYMIVDVRELSEYAEGHIPGAVLVPLGTIQSEDLTLLPDKDQKLLLYCRSGNRSGQAAKKLVSLGYTNVYDFGGIVDWPYEVIK